MSEDLDNVFKEGWELDTGKYYLNVISLLTKNEMLLTSIHNKQVEIREILNGKVGQELEETIKEKVMESLLKIDDFAKQSYHKKIQNILK